jgi:hypothetical protein
MAVLGIMTCAAAAIADELAAGAADVVDGLYALLALAGRPLIRP